MAPGGAFHGGGQPTGATRIGRTAPTPVKYTRLARSAGGPPFVQDDLGCSRASVSVSSADTALRPARGCATPVAGRGAELGEPGCPAAAR